MIEVRIRHEADTKATHLCSATVDGLDHVVKTVHGWGVADTDTPILFGQFVVDEAAAYFEIVIAEGIA